MRITTRTQDGRAGIEAAGAECWVGTPDRIGSLRYALENVSLLMWLLGTASGGGRELHGRRLEFMLSQTIDTTVRGVDLRGGGDRRAGERLVGGGRRPGVGGATGCRAGSSSPTRRTGRRGWRRRRGRSMNWWAGPPAAQAAPGWRLDRCALGAVRGRASGGQPGNGVRRGSAGSVDRGDEGEAVEEVGEDAGGGAPDEVGAGGVAVGREGTAVAGEGAVLVGGGELGQRTLDHGFDLERLGDPGAVGGDQADERVDRELGDGGHGGGERAEQLDGVGFEADLLVGFAQGGVGELDVGRVAAAAGEGDLAGVVSQGGAALDEDDVELVVAEVEGNENRGLDEAVELGRGRVEGVGRRAGPPGGGGPARGSRGQLEALDALGEHDLAVEGPVDRALGGDREEASDLVVG